jgi:hypothetical protein
MTRISIELTEDLRRKAEARAAEGGHASVEQYIESLVEADAGATDDEDFGAPEHLTIRSREDLEAKLQEGIESGPKVEMTDDEWASIRREVAERIEGGRSAANRNAGNPFRPRKAR